VRNPTIDILRGIAVLLVFFRHTSGFPLVSQLGWVGVDLFFVLSGFLVSGLLFAEYQKTLSIAPGRFLLRRGFKIYPRFYLLLAVSLAVKGFYGKPPASSSFWAEALFVQNYTEGIWSHTWSLAVEEHFYLLLTAAIVWLARRGGANPFAALPKWAAVLSAAILGARVLTWMLRPQTSPNFDYYAHILPSHLRMDSLLAGVILSYYHAFHEQNLRVWVHRFRAWLQPASIALLAPIAFLNHTDPFIFTVGFSMTAWGFVLLLASVVSRPKLAAQPTKGARSLEKLGRMSYAFYLWHALVIFVAEQALPSLSNGGFTGTIGFIFLTFSTSLAVAWFTTWLVEVPLLRLRDQWFPSGTKTHVVTNREAPAVLA
jgi:peptidoglycan/LPS O-acetylase OafA/YrhL